MVTERCNPILLVEDNPDHAELIMDVIRQSKVRNEVIWIKDGEQGLDYLYRRGEYAGRPPEDDPAVVLLDIKLPGIDGLEVLRLVREDEQFNSLPVVMLTTSAQEAEVLQAYSHHANSYVVKPMNFQEFQERVQDLNVYWTLTNFVPDECVQPRKR